MSVVTIIVTIILITAVIAITIITKSEKKKCSINKKLSDCINKPANKLNIDHEAKYQQTGSLRAKRISTSNTRQGSIRAMSSLAQKVNSERGEEI